MKLKMSTSGLGTLAPLKKYSVSSLERFTVNQRTLDANGKVIRYQVSTTTHTAAGRDQRRSRLIQHPPQV